MTSRIRRGAQPPAATRRTSERRACATQELELAVLAEVDGLLSEARVYLAGRDADDAWIDVVAGHGGGPVRLAVDAPDWGRRGDGALRLAVALLHDVLGRPVELGLALAFADDVLRALPAAGFALSAVEVRGWVIFQAALEVPERWR
ncbi:MAG TPA: DUF6166 domain-containing protein [Baekduia sp.]|uniref:DUF6166 domain-containing protein n=1 Tax=Baekduia sp. TaxID=2600305 RepID=UPI002C6FAE61|nr:DUF6166 domain-containing protein [Baekduia sp.]HMJ33471.1 DUF6166 domain-containing protein [Baekduia sp.]